MKTDYYMNENPRNKLKEIPFKERNSERDEFSELGDDQFKLIDRGYEYVESGDYQQAYKLFCMGASLDNTDVEILNGLGIALCELGKLDQSRQILERAARLHPDDAITYANLAGVYWEIENYDKAIYYYHQSLEIDNEIEETHFNLINLYLETGALYMGFILCCDYAEKFPEDKDAKELMDDIILNLALSVY